MLVPLLVVLSGCTGCSGPAVTVEPAAPRRGLDPIACAVEGARGRVTWQIDGRPTDIVGPLPPAASARGSTFTCTVEAGGRTGRADITPGPAGGNVLLIVLDDVGNDKIAAYEEHPRPPKTPHIDGLASRGVLFRNAWSLPSCSPTRASYLTGRHASRTGVGRIVDSWKDDWQLRSGEITIPEMLALSPLTYDSSLAGKWHLASTRGGSPATDPGDQGFAWYAGSIDNLGALLPGGGRSHGYYNWFKDTNGELAQVRQYATTDTADDTIARMGAMSEPWFLLASFNAAHQPPEPPPERLHTDRQLAADSPEWRVFHAMVEALDTEIGRILQAVPENTTVMVLGDNGTPYFGATPPRVASPHMNKGSITEGGINVPLVVAGPLVVAPGRETPALVHTTDVFSTIAAIAGVDVDRLGRPIDGVSFLPVLADPDVQTIRETVYTERFLPNGPGPYTNHLRAVRDRRYKLVHSRYGNNTRVSFHDLKGRHLDGPDLLARGGRGALPPDAAASFDALQEVMKAAMSEMHVDKLVDPAYLDD